MNISKYFTLQELTASATAERLGIDNTPSAAVLANLQCLAKTLDRIRQHLGRPIRINSGYRCAALNAAVGGVGESAHLAGLAADLWVPGWTARQAAEAIIASAVPFDQVILEYDRWVHVAVALQAPRQQVLTVRKGQGYCAGLV
ncbi:D-Ala-D-Ala carboxypeptidase family metallohydrolase [Pseudomonas sp. nanlin1]|uniref:D-Ala-D-Ala carboxypeptidase family metallohydrolase n=1 Tax=Pseudomonas sp. nanlin1 TaxID=3040605 RepID=UPI00388D7715